MSRRTRIVLVIYLLAFAFLMCWVPWDIERHLETGTTLQGPTYYGWVWATANPRQRDGALLAGKFGARWIETSLDDFTKAYNAHQDASLLPDRWNFELTKQFMHIAWSKVFAETLALTACTLALLLWPHKGRATLEAAPE
jgi:hypothetical protein